MATIPCSVSVRDPGGKTATQSFSFTTTPVAPGAWPDATNSGVPAGTTLTNYTGTMNITTSGTLVENKTISGQLTVKASNVTIRNCRINTNGWWGVEGENSPNIRVERCTIVGGNLTNSGILGSGTFIGNDISHTSIGVQLTSGTSTVKDNYIHDLFYGNGDPHYDGMLCISGQTNTLIEHNHFIVPSNGGTASILISTTFGAINGVTVNNNLMKGVPSYTVYAVMDTNTRQPISGVKFTNNTMQRGYYGYADIENNTPVWTNNRDFVTGNLIPSP